MSKYPGYKQVTANEADDIANTAVWQPNPDRGGCGSYIKNGEAVLIIPEPRIYLIPDDNDALFGPCDQVVFVSSEEMEKIKSRKKGKMTPQAEKFLREALIRNRKEPLE